MPKIISIFIIGFVVFTSSIIGAAMGTIVGAILLPIKVVRTISDDSAGVSSDKI